MQVIYDKLWKILIDKKINKSQLRILTGISTNTLAKLGKNEPVNLNILMKICEELNCDISDICEFIKNDEGREMK